MTKCLAAAAISVVLVTAAQTVSAQSGWVSLFDGKDISTHWRGFKQQGMPAGWEIVDGTIAWTGAGRPTGRPVDSDLVSIEQYANFELEWEWKLPPGGNSGIMFHVSEDLEATYHSGPEYQLLDNARHPDGKDPRTSTGANYAIQAPHHDMSKPIGEWNQSKLVVNGAHVEHWLNGMKVVEYELWTPEWTALVKKSKFNQWPAYEMNKSGHIVIQEHGARVQYRNLRVRRLQ
ncbi:MAG: DUF1080 domain-containing protein [Acidobacteria bacterium]|nr:DUF1080 domain-containing protein [Acidobacteriota bacterium]